MGVVGSSNVCVCVWGGLNMKMELMYPYPKVDYSTANLLALLSSVCCSRKRKRSFLRETDVFIAPWQYSACVVLFSFS